MPIDRASMRRQHRHHDRRSETHPVTILADNVDKVANIGGILRTAEAFRCERVVSNRVDPDLGGTMGAQYWMSVKWAADLATEAQRLRLDGYCLIALEQAPQAVPIVEFLFPLKSAIIIGAEMHGVSPQLMNLVDQTVFIPQAGLTKSLNVGIAAGIVLYEYSRQHWMRDFRQPDRHLAPAALSVRVPNKTRNLQRDPQ